MRLRAIFRGVPILGVLLLSALGILTGPAWGAPARLIGIHSARVMSQSLPWIAQEAGLFAKYDLDFQLVYIAASAAVTAAMLAGEAEVAVTGGVGNVRAYVQGAKDLVFIGGIKNVMTQSLVARPEIRTVSDLKGRKIGVTRIGSNTHYFAIQVLRRFGLDAPRDITFIQTGGEPETVAALASGSIDVASTTPPGDARLIALGFRYVVYGPDLRIPYAATFLATRRSLIARRPEVLGRFMQVMAEAAKILHTDREFVYKVLGKYLRVEDRKVLDAAYEPEIKALEQRLTIDQRAIEATLQEVAMVDARARQVRPEELIDRRFLDQLHRGGFFDRLWAQTR
ncbi:MAG: ABC transporter substrate-binding protein [Deltaproteobacteria bacterium]|nr:ABC transporter substrate-binding protein [Deltaproteobacteria bacterium]